MRAHASAVVWDRRVDLASDSCQTELRSDRSIGVAESITVSIQAWLHRVGIALLIRVLSTRYLRFRTIHCVVLLKSVLCVRSIGRSVRIFKMAATFVY